MEVLPRNIICHCLTASINGLSETPGIPQAVSLKSVHFAAYRIERAVHVFLISTCSGDGGEFFESTKIDYQEF